MNTSKGQGSRVKMMFFFLTLATWGLTLTAFAEIKCFDCHDDQKANWLKNPHSTLEAACEACHGSGAKHIESLDKKDIINPAKLEAAEIIELCGGCHFRKLDRELFENSMHPQLGFSCLDCHDPHKVDNSKLLKASEVKLVCYQCHQESRKIFEKSKHGQHGLQCTDCHLPHGSKVDKLFKQMDNGSDICQSCHTDKLPHHFIADKRMLALRKLRCTNCHLPHAGLKNYLRYKKEGLCIHCHKEVY